MIDRKPLCQWSETEIRIACCLTGSVRKKGTEEKGRTKHPGLLGSIPTVVTGASKAKLSIVKSENS